jgi:hypothetical protein
MLKLLNLQTDSLVLERRKFQSAKKFKSQVVFLITSLLEQGFTFTKRI